LTAAHKYVRTATLDIAFEESGVAEGVPVVLMHGWPYDPRSYDEVIPTLSAAGARVIVPYLRGFGATRFRSAETPRSGQQAALGKDLRELLDVLAAERAVLAGYDWAGRAACIVAALWPERVRGLVTVNGYNIQDIAGSAEPQTPIQERRFWYQWYFQTERGRIGLERNRGRCAGCCGKFGRRIGRLTTPHSSVAPSPSLTGTSLRSRSIPIGIVTATPRATRSSKRSSGGLPQSPKSMCQPSPCRVTPTASCLRRFQKSTRRSFQGRTSAICWRGSVTTRLRKRRGNSPARFSN
jgi:alpha/beta hydrolase family protein